MSPAPNAAEARNMNARIFTGALFALFVVAMLLALLAATNVYRALQDVSEHSSAERLSLALIANQVRANDSAEAIMAGQGPEGPSLVLVEQLPAAGDDQAESAAAVNEATTDEGADAHDAGAAREAALAAAEVSKAETRIYLYKGQIVEEYAIAGSLYTPERAAPIVESSVFEFSYRDGLLSVTTDNGTVRIAKRCAGLAEGGAA